MLGPPNPTTTPLVNQLVVETEVPTSVSVAVDDGTHRWTIDLPGVGTSHLHALLGFRPAASHQLLVTVRDEAGRSESWPAPLVFDTDPVPSDFPVFRVVQSDPTRMEPGYTFFGANSRGDDIIHVIVAIDAAGDVRWYHHTEEAAMEVNRARGGGLVFNLERTGAQEIDMSGNPLVAWVVHPPTQPWEVQIDLYDAHHDVKELPDGTLLMLDTEIEVLPDFPTSEDDRNAPPADTPVAAATLVHLARDGRIIERWSTLELFDPRRIGRDSLNLYILSQEYGRPVRDWLHVNAVFYDATDDTMLISARHQDAMLKFDRTGRLLWILGPEANWGPAWLPYVLRPVGVGENNYHQHACSVTPAGTVLAFDNGNYRASAYEPIPPGPFYSRAVEFRVDPVAMTMEQVWEFQPDVDPPLFVPSLGDADALPLTGNRLVTFGNLVGDTASARVFEVTGTTPAEILWEVAVDPLRNGWGPVFYRSQRLPTLGPP